MTARHIKAFAYGHTRDGETELRVVSVTRKDVDDAIRAERVAWGKLVIAINSHEPRFRERKALHAAYEKAADTAKRILDAWERQLADV